MIDWCERGLVPDPAIRIGIRRLLKQRLARVDAGTDQTNHARTQDLIKEFSDGPIALVPDLANEQHYEVPAEFFELTLGPRRKYSSCVWPDGCTTLADAEIAALTATCQRADLEDGMSILELGCGWGSLSLWMAEKYPAAELTVVSNSSSQRKHIERRAAEQGIDNLNVITADINEFETTEQFDRVVSVEMFEHVRNHSLLMQRISQWLKPNGKLFVHVFCHRELTYKFQDEGESDWMSRYFFSGGIMPGQDLLTNYQSDLRLAEQWQWNGRHYQQTSESWLANMTRNKREIMPILEQTYGPTDAKRWYHRWRMFFLACSELFGYRGGNEWLVAHYLFENQRVATANPQDAQLQA